MGLWGALWREAVCGLGDRTDGCSVRVSEALSSTLALLKELMHVWVLTGACCITVWVGFFRHAKWASTCVHAVLACLPATALYLKWVVSPIRIPTQLRTNLRDTSSSPVCFACAAILACEFAGSVSPVQPVRVS